MLFCSVNMEFSVVLFRRGVPVGVVYAGNNAVFRSEVFPQRTRMGVQTVLIRGGSDDGSVCPVLRLQAVFPVLTHVMEHDYLAK